MLTVEGRSGYLTLAAVVGLENVVACPAARLVSALRLFLEEVHLVGEAPRLRREIVLVREQLLSAYEEVSAYVKSVLVREQLLSEQLLSEQLLSAIVLVREQLLSAKHKRVTSLAQVSLVSRLTSLSPGARGSLLCNAGHFSATPSVTRSTRLASKYGNSFCN